MAINNLQNDFYRLRVICFTEKNNDILMWAHYGGAHTGICLGFEVEDTNLEAIYKVHYNDEYPILDLENVLNVGGTAKILHNKSSHWSYEKEWRKMFIEPATFLCDYPGHFIEIILGARISENDENQIRQILAILTLILRKHFFIQRDTSLLLNNQPGA